MMPAMSLRAWFPAVVCFVASALGPLLPGQDKPPPKDDDEILKLGRIDPYTGGDAAAMALAGVVAYGPFAWADHVTTADVDRVLGEKRFLWLETAHFRIGSSMPSIGWPEDNDALLVITSWRPAESFVRNSTFAHSAAGGIVSGWNSSQPGPDLRASNSFTGIAAACQISVPRGEDNKCPGNDSTPDCY